MNCRIFLGATRHKWHYPYPKARICKRCGHMELHGAWSGWYVVNFELFQNRIELHKEEIEKRESRKQQRLEDRKRGLDWYQGLATTTKRGDE